MLRSIVKDIFVWFYWYPLRWFIQKIPIRYAYLLARLSGGGAYYLFVKKRLKLKDELLYILKDVEKYDCEKIIKDAFKVNFFNEFEVFLYNRLNRENIVSLVECIGLENIDNALKAEKGVMLLFAHFGANQMVMPAMGCRGYRMSQMSAPPTVWVEKMPNKKFSKMGMRALELRWQQELSLPVTHINIFGPLKKVFSTLKNNEILGIAIDGGGGEKRVAVDVLGRKVSFSTGAVEIAMRTGCTVLPVFMTRAKDGRNRMTIEAPLNIYSLKDDKDAVQRNISTFVKRFEPYLLDFPSHYINFLAVRRIMESQGDAPFFLPD